MIRVHPVPVEDQAFRECIEDALAALMVGASDSTLGLAAQDERMLRAALAPIRRRYPDAWIRRREPLATIPGEPETWYVFREDSLTRPHEGRRPVFRRLTRRLQRR